MTRGDVQTRLRQFESLCREQGLPVTVQRRHVLKAVLETDDHPTADQVYERVKKRLPELSRTTVYRVLEMLVRLGVIRRVNHPGAAARFDGRTDRHHHLVCRMCNRVVDVDGGGLESLRLRPGERHGFEIEDYSVHFLGVCPECGRKAPERSASDEK